jgi:RNA polymerase sigma-B factor
MSAKDTRHDTDYEQLRPLFVRLTDQSLSEQERRRVRDEIVEGHLPIAEHIAQKYQHRGQSLEDLRQVARLGLVGAVNRFDPHRGTDFVSFAVPTIMGEIRRYFRDATWMLSVPRRLKELNRSISRATAELENELGRAPRPAQIAARMGISLEAVYEGLRAGMAYRAESLDVPAVRHEDYGETPQLGCVDTGLESVENSETLHTALAELPDRETEILRMRFFEELTQREIAARMGISQVHVSRLLAHSVARLRDSVLCEEG